MKLTEFGPGGHVPRAPLDPPMSKPDGYQISDKNPAKGKRKIPFMFVTSSLIFFAFASAFAQSEKVKGQNVFITVAKNMSDSTENRTQVSYYPGQHHNR